MKVRIRVDKAALPKNRGKYFSSPGSGLCDRADAYVYDCETEADRRFVTRSLRRYKNHGLVLEVVHES